MANGIAAGLGILAWVGVYKLGWYIHDTYGGTATLWMSGVGIPLVLIYCLLRDRYGSRGKSGQRK